MVRIKEKIMIGIVTLVTSNLLFANQTLSTQNLSEQKIDSNFQQLEQRIFKKIQSWEESLNQQDFEQMNGQYQLKATEKAKLCTIFQDVIDEAYLHAVKHKQDFSQQSQQVIADKNTFIAHLGIENNMLNTQMGFNCLVR